MQFSFPSTGSLLHFQFADGIRHHKINNDITSRHSPGSSINHALEIMTSLFFALNLKFTYFLQKWWCREVLFYF